MTRSASKQDLVRSRGARPLVADVLDPDAVAHAVAPLELAAGLRAGTRLSEGRVDELGGSAFVTPLGECAEWRARRGLADRPNEVKRCRRVASRCCERHRVQ